MKRLADHWRALTRARQPLPGSLCDEVCNGHPTATAAGKWEQVDDKLAAEIAELRLQLAEAIRERDDEARINDELRRANFGLRKRIEGLELTIRAYAGRTAGTPAPHDHSGDLVVPWPAPTS
jgi:hypothetical protein